MGAAWPLHGRQTELECALAAVQSGRRSVIAFEGQRGVGKTRLLDEFVKRAEKDLDLHTIRVAGTYAAKGVPLGALAILMPPGMTIDDEHNESLAVQRTVAEIRDIATRRPAALVIDDAHLLDDLSAAAIQLASGAGCRVVLSVLNDVDVPPALHALLTGDSVASISVVPFGDHELAQLLQLALGAPVESAAVAALQRYSRSNLRYVRELVDYAVDSRILRLEMGIWHLGGHLEVSRRLKQMVQSEWQALSPEQLDVLELVATAEMLTYPELVNLTDISTAEKLERRGFLRSSDVGGRIEVRIDHPLQAEVLRSSVSPLARPGLYRRLASALSEEPKADADKIRIATWQMRAGVGDPALMLEAAWIARFTFDFVLSEELARAAVEAGAGFDAKFLVALVTLLQGDSAAGERMLQELAASATDESQYARIALSRMDHVGFFLGDTDRAMRIAEQAEEKLDDPNWLDAIAGRRAGLRISADGPRITVERSEPLLATSSGRSLAMLSHMAAWSMVKLGRLDDAEKTAHLGISVEWDKYGPPEWYSTYHKIDLCNVLVQRGQLNQAHREALVIYQQAVDEQSMESEALMAFQLAYTVNERGFPNEAARFAREAVALFRQLGRPQFEHLSLLVLVLAEALQGKASEARTTLTEVDKLVRSPADHDHADFALARGWAAAAAGDLIEAQGILRHGVDNALRAGDLTGGASALHSIGRLGAAKSVSSDLADLAQSTGVRLIQLRADHMAALADHDAPALDGISSNFETAGAYLLAAEAAADSAVSWHRAGQSRPAARRELRVQMLVAQTGHPSTPALAALPTRTYLTPTERAIAYQAASGQTNKSIASSMHVSVRTVESHLHRAYSKLGIGSRSELADVMTDLQVE